MRPSHAIRLAPAALRWHGGAMVHLSVAIGRFVEALFWAIFRAVGWVAVMVALAAGSGLLVFVAVRRLVRRR